jgi:flagellar hook-length control protein FliK
MASRVSVTTSSHANSAVSRSGGAGSTPRDLPVGGAAASGFSSQMSAAARPPATHEAGAEPPATANAKDAKNTKDTKGSAGGSSTPTTTPAKPPNATSSDQAQSAAATATEADASSVDPDLAIQDGKAPDKAASKAKSDSDNADNASTSIDPATLALLLAASGLQIDPRIAGSGQQSSGGNSDGAPPQDSTANAIAGSVAAGAVLSAALGMSPTAAPASQSATGSTSGDSSVAVGGASSAAKQVAQFAVDELTLGDASADSASADASLLQNKSAAPDSMQPQPTSSLTPNGLPEMMRGLSSSSAPAGAVERTISVPVSDRNWSGAVAGQVQWLVNSNIQSATLQLSPEHLGPIEVRIDIQPSQVNVSFTASHPDTRSALEQSVPQLREILANGGLTLGQATVQQETRSGSHYSPSASRGSAGSAKSVDSVAISPTQGLGLIDEYA